MADEVKQLSKRSELRFRIKPRSVRYKANDLEGEAFISDISTGGCSVQKATFSLSLGDKVLFFSTSSTLKTL